MTPVEIVVQDGAPHIWTESKSQKGRNAVRGDRVAIMAYKGTSGVLVRGRARLIRPGEPAYDDLAQAFLTKYKREETYGNDLIVRVEPERVATWE